MTIDPKSADLLGLSASALRDISMGYPPDELAGPGGKVGLNSLLRELVRTLRTDGIDDDGAWDCEATRDIPLARNCATAQTLGQVAVIAVDLPGLFGLDIHVSATSNGLSAEVVARDSGVTEAVTLPYDDPACMTGMPETNQGPIHMASVRPACFQIFAGDRCLNIIASDTELTMELHDAADIDAAEPAQLVRFPAEHFDAPEPNL